MIHLKNFILKTRHSSRFYVLLFCLLFLSIADLASEKAILRWEDFDDWQCLNEPQITNATNIFRFQSPVMERENDFDQLILSWNVEAKSRARFSFLVRIRMGEIWSDFYHLGHWRFGEQADFRTSVNHQNDDFAKVLTDILMIKKPAQAFQIKVLIQGNADAFSKIKCIALSLIDSRIKQFKKVKHKLASSKRSVWGKALALPRLCQFDYEGGEVWCSPASLGMVLDYWGEKLNRPELSLRLPQLAAHVFDPAWNGTGNWVFNTAFAGSFQDMRAYVVRLRGVSDLESFIHAQIPMPVSVAYSVLKGKRRKAGDGHLLVCVGFTDSGDVVVNDPAKSEVRWVYDRDDFARAWQHSHNTAYLIYPRFISLPEDTGLLLKIIPN